MTQEDPLWLQGAVTPRTYSAREDRQLITALFSEGVISGLSVTPGGAMDVTVGIGSAIILGDDQANQGNYLAVTTAAETIAIAAAPGSNSRIDLVYYRINDPNAGGPAGENSAFGVVVGVVAASPAVPALPTSAIPLAQVLVAAGTVTITQAMITGVRTAARLIHGDQPGVLKPFAGPEASVPVGHLLCRGQAVSRDTYFGLFGVIGSTYGAGDGSTTFNLPDLRGRSVFGLDNMGGTDAGLLAGANTLGLKAGTETVALVEANLPQHLHTVTDPGHGHSIAHDHPSTQAVANTVLQEVLSLGAAAGNQINALTFGQSGSPLTVDIPNYVGQSSDVFTGITVGPGAGISTPINKMPPYILMNWIIKT